ncbi:class II aldolase/adducin family protein [Actibacterium sp. 188UL27-1]|uniref:class II aldolase/adducin family protein n=1 Tax=Actibacterium sp. 188UL27-1 TaxID=2786961 RepID=UPI00195D15FB|nr:class II aldolase/adducin family protein [Actibacterium sp. 188UL27-1]MBM7068686.1 class II aldolase/adducin family protein [Actibacterium sp. 188UL27-1]
MSELNLRKELIEACRDMNALGINQGTSGNISVKYEGAMLISPSATPYHSCTPDMVASLPLDSTGAYDGPRKPSTEWRFHLALHASRDDVNAVVHAHPTYCTTLAMARKTIPAAHYMIAAFGGNTVELADYALFGSEALNKHVLKAMEGRQACLMANHGMCAVGESLDKAMWRAVELETIAKQYYHSLLIGGPVLLSDAEIAETAKSFEGYGLQDD